MRLMQCLRQTLSGIKMTEGKGSNFQLFFTGIDGLLAASHRAIRTTNYKI